MISSCLDDDDIIMLVWWYHLAESWKVCETRSLEHLCLGSSREANMCSSSMIIVWLQDPGLSSGLQGLCLTPETLSVSSFNLKGQIMTLFYLVKVSRSQDFMNSNLFGGLKFGLIQLLSRKKSRMRSYSYLRSPCTLHFSQMMISGRRIARMMISGSILARNCGRCVDSSQI